MRTYSALGTVSSNLHNSFNLHNTKGVNYIIHPLYTRRLSPRKLNHLSKVTKLGCGKIFIIKISNSKGCPFHCEMQLCLNMEGKIVNMLDERMHVCFCEFFGRG